MKALVKFAAEPGNMEIRDVEEPKVKPGYVKIEIKATGICGSDIHILHSDIAIPVRRAVAVKARLRILSWVFGMLIQAYSQFRVKIFHAMIRTAFPLLSEVFSRK